MPHEPVRSIVIIGGGTAGWMAATYLARRLTYLNLSITVVDSAAIGTVGVGEATVPAIRDFLSAIELGEPDVLRETGGTIKYGIRFDGWGGEAHRFFHPFGLYGVGAGGVAFHQYWLKLNAAGRAGPIGDYCLATQLARNGLFLPPADRPANDLGVFNFALHFDAAKFAALLRRLALANRVAHVDGRITQVATDPARGHVTAVTLDDGRQIAGDLWIDASGFRSLLLGEALGVPYVDWRHWLPCDRAVAIPCTAAAGDPVPYTVATARTAGWQWRIPLRHRIGNGSVYCSAFQSDGDAEDALIASLEGEPLADPNRLRFVTGHRERFWSGNVVGLGLASGFLEPLESTSISLIQSGLERFVALFPDKDCDPRLAATYNRQSVLEFERLRDFLFLHYLANHRDEPFWQAIRAVEPPEPLQIKLDAWRSGGEFVRNEWDTFQDPSWLSLYAGFGDLPQRHSPLADAIPDDTLADSFARMREAIGKTLAHAEPHGRFLARVAGA
ncbi:tryptophan halogenase family protein [Sphingomonas hankookensis]|uniref:Tryptophan halogenase n=1 Tax=Sphingomonas hankookensis TaxID=563996 RepID=A0ABR5YB66_9SPHN|nr:tryptophan halogenase family protein [Sphingomonas hankookensis]KZE13252.1 tryptophan halogenase [Sphingomonas hankookensis]